MRVRCLFEWKHTHTHALDSGQGEDVAAVFTSLVTATTNGNVVCYVTMRVHMGFEKIFAKKEAFV